MTGKKVWEGGPETKPTIELQLYKDGVAEGERIELKDGEATYTWTGLPETDNIGNKYKYTVKEVEVPENYTNKEENEVEETEAGLTITITNTYVIPKTSITGYKVWESGPQVKPTIKLQLYKDGVAEGNPVEFKNGTTDYTWTNLDKTDIDGNLYKYTIDEVDVPSGYVKSISDDGLTITNKYNPYIPSDSEGRIKIIKKDSSTEELLAGAEFDIIDSNSNIVDSLVIDETGQATSENLPLGKYTIKETKAPEGYVLATETKDITIASDGEVKILEFTNTKIKGHIKLIKVDGEGKVLAGAEFALYDSKGEQVGEKVISNEDGEVIFKDIVLGEYTIKETKAPKGYEMSKKQFKVAIEINGTTVVKDIDGEDLRLENTMIPTDPIDPDEPGNPTDPTDPINPEDSDGTGQPGNPTDPEAPIGPGNPGGPLDPNKPGEPTDPNKPIDPNKPGKPADADGDRLAQTGTNINFLIAIGTIILLMGVMFVYDGKKIKR